MTRFTALIMTVALLAMTARTDDPPKPVKELPKKVTADERKEQEEEWNRLRAKGRLAYEKGDNKAAKESFEKALEVARKLYPNEGYPEGHANLSESLYRLARVLVDMNKFMEAEPFAREAVAMDRKLYLKQDSPQLAASLNNLAGILAVMKKPSKALPFAKEAVEVYRKVYPKRDHPQLAASLSNVAAILEDLGKPADAEPVYREVVEVYRRVHPKRDHPQLAASLSNQVFVLYTLGKVKDAEPFAREALEVYQRVYPKQDHAEVAGSLSLLAGMLGSLEKPAEAEPLYRDALAMYLRLYPKQDHLSVAQAIYNVGVVSKSLGKLTEAEGHYRDAVEMYRRLLPKQDHPRFAASLCNLADVLWRGERPAEAEPLYREAVEMYRRLHPKLDHPELAICLNNLGVVLRDLGLPGEAEPFAREALTMRQRLFLLGDHPDIAASLSNLGNVLQDAGRPTEAEPLLRDAIKMYHRLHPKQDRPELALLLSNLAAVRRNQGVPEEAEELTRDALAMYRRLYPKQDHPYVAHALCNLSVVSLARGKLAEAEELTRDALAAYRRLYPKQVHPDVARALNNLAIVLIHRQKFADAEPHLRDSLNMLTALHGKRDHPALVRVMANLGNLLERQGKTKDASRLNQDALSMNRRLVVEFAQKKMEGDALSFAVITAVLRDQFLSNAFATRADPATVYTELFADQGAIARVYEQRQLRARIASNDPKLAKLLGELANLRAQRTALLLSSATLDEGTAKKRNEELERCERALGEKDLAIRKLLPAVERLDKLNKATPVDLQKVLPKDAALVQYVRWDQVSFDVKQQGKEGEKRTEKYLAVVVTPEKVTLVDLPAADQIEPAVNSWRLAITGDEVKKHSPASAEETAKLGLKVRELVWDGVRRQLPSWTKVVYISPDAALCKLPFAALPGGKADAVLLDEFAIASVPHGPFLFDQLWPQDGRKMPPAGALVVGGVKYDAEPPARAKTDSVVASRGPLVDEKTKAVWKFLPATVDEAKGVAKAASERKLTVESMTDDQATPQAVLAALPKAKYAHLATHGFFADESFRGVFRLDARDFERSRLGERVGGAARSPLVMTGFVCAGANHPKAPGRGIITGEQLIDLDLSGLDLAVLSACETGLGDVADGQGVYGLQRAFHYAGAKNVVCSLWKVDDLATAALMGEFYRQLWDEKQPPVEALRRAQLAVYRADPKRFEEMALRGIGVGEKDLSKVPERAADPKDPKAGNHPRLWAAFTLSGLGK